MRTLFFGTLPVALAMSMAFPAQAGPPTARLKLSTHRLPPYSDLQGIQPKGLAVQVVQCAAQRMGLKLDMEFVPWARAQKHAQDGDSDGFFAASQSAARDAFASLSATIAPQEWRWYFLDKAALQPQHPDFKTKARVSSFLGANMQTWLTEQGYQSQLPPINSDALLRMLLAGRVDAVLANHLVMDLLLQSHPERKSVRSELAQDRPLGVYFTHRYLARQSEDFLQQFNGAIKVCLSGTPK